MIRLIRGDEAHLFPRETDSVFRARAEVFGKRLGWSVEVVDGQERDRFDAMNPLYLVSIDEETGEAQGSMRLLPSTGPHMLGDCFAPSFPERVALQAPRIWESTRMCVHPESRAPYTSTGARRPTFELMLCMCEVGLMSGVSFFQGVYDRTMTRIYRQTRWGSRSRSRRRPGLAACPSMPASGTSAPRHSRRCAPQAASPAASSSPARNRSRVTPPAVPRACLRPARRRCRWTLRLTEPDPLQDKALGFDPAIRMSAAWTFSRAASPSLPRAFAHFDGHQL